MRTDEKNLDAGNVEQRACAFRLSCLVLSALGVERAAIERDYLKSNEAALPLPRISAQVQMLLTWGMFLEVIKLWFDCPVSKGV